MTERIERIERIEASASGLGCAFVVLAALIIIVILWMSNGVAKNRSAICDLRLEAAANQADSVVIYDERWPWYEPAKWRRCPREER